MDRRDRTTLYYKGKICLGHTANEKNSSHNVEFINIFLNIISKEQSLNCLR